MTLISNFEQVRYDGKVIPAAMTVAEMLELGWKPSKVVALRWFYNNKIIECIHPKGIHGIVVPGGNYVVAIIEDNEKSKINHLTIFSHDGLVHRIINNTDLNIESVDCGRFSWFEPSNYPGINRFCVVFQTVNKGDFFCDIDIKEMSVLTKKCFR